MATFASPEAVIIPPYVLMPGASISNNESPYTPFDATASGLFNHSIFVGMIHGGNTSLTYGCQARCRQVLDASLGGSGTAPGFAQAAFYLPSLLTPCVRQVNYGSGYAAGVKSLAFDGSGGTAFVVNQTLGLWSVAAIPTSTGLLSSVGSPISGQQPELVWASSSSTPLRLPEPALYPHADNECFGPATCATFPLPRGGKWIVSFDYQDSSGEAILVFAWVIKNQTGAGT